LASLRSILSSSSGKLIDEHHFKVEASDSPSGSPHSFSANDKVVAGSPLCPFFSKGESCPADAALLALGSVFPNFHRVIDELVDEGNRNRDLLNVTFRAALTGMQPLFVKIFIILYI
jgi:hypothetical protein